MHCPNCGKRSQVEQKFCRSCGMNLTAVSQAVAEHLSTPHPDQLRPDRLLEHSSALRRMYKLFLMVGVVFLIGMSLLVIWTKEVLGLTGIIIILVGILLALYGIFSALRKKFLNYHESPLPNSLPRPDSNLPSGSLPGKLSVITEPTTEALSFETSKLPEHNEN